MNPTAFLKSDKENYGNLQEDDEDLGYWRRILGGVKYPKDRIIAVNVIPKEFFVEESK